MGKSGFIVITAYDAPESRDRACQLGVTDFVLKPFDLPRFLEVSDHNVKPFVKETPVQEIQKLNQKLERLLAVLKNGRNGGTPESQMKDET